MYAKIVHVSTKDLRICAKNQQMIIIKSSNNPIVDVLRPAQKLQVWNTYIPVGCVLHPWHHELVVLFS